MNRTALSAPPPGTNVPDLLRAAADGFRAGAIRWGQDKFITTDGCRCLAGGIAWAIHPDTPFGNPYEVTDPVAARVAEQAMEFLADLLVEAYGAADRGYHGFYGTWIRDAVKTTGDWNDAPDRTLDDVLELLDDAVAHAERAVAA